LVRPPLLPRTTLAPLLDRDLMRRLLLDCALALGAAIAPIGALGYLRAFALGLLRAFHAFCALGTLWARFLAPRSLAAVAIAIAVAATLVLRQRRHCRAARK
jgi:hypothetical protein